MQQDFSWYKSALAYQAMYNDIMGLPADTCPNTDALSEPIKS
jgi:starch synthase